MSQSDFEIPLLASPFSPVKTEPSTLPPHILQSRNQYRCCHIRIPGDSQRFAAIAFNGKYYSLLRVVPESQQALKLCDRLTSNGSEALITPIAKGYGVWTLEPDARLDSPGNGSSPRLDQPSPPPTCKILDSQRQIEVCRIRVPDLSEPLRAIVVGGKYYGLFKVVENRQQALELAAKLGLRGDETVITKDGQGDSVWVLEPDAMLIQ